MSKELKFSLSELNHPGAAIVERGGEKFAFTADGIVKFGTKEVIEEAKGIELFEDALLHVRDTNTAIPKDVSAKLLSSIEAVGQKLPADALRTEVQSNVASILKTAASIGKDTTAEQLTQIAKDSPRPLDFLTEAQETILKDSKHDLSAIRQTAAAEIATAKEVAKLAEDYLKVAEGKDPKKMLEFVKSNSGKFKDLNITAEHVADFPILGVIKNKVVEIEPLIKEQETLNRAVKLTTGEAKAAATTRLAEISKEIDGHFTGELKDIRSAVTSHFAPTSATAAAAESGSGWAAKLFFKSEEKLAEVAAKKGVALSELGTASKLSLKKGAGWGALVVGAAYVAGVGGKGKHTEQVAAQQLNEQGAAIGA